jgi:integrase
MLPAWATVLVALISALAGALSPVLRDVFQARRDRRQRGIELAVGIQSIGEGTFARWWARCLADANVRYRNPHVARHTFATTWRRRGLDLDEIQLLLGHESIRTTSDLYVHTRLEHVKRRMLHLTRANA